MNAYVDYLETLPDDPELALVQVGKDLREKYLSTKNNEEIKTADKIKYATELNAFHDAFDLKIFTNFPTNPHNGFNYEFNEFVRLFDYWSMRVEIRSAKKLKSSSTVLKLTPAIRKLLHSHTSKIREILTPLNISEKKREALFKKLGALENEIDRNRTNTEAAMAFTLEVTSTVGEAANNLEPVVNILNKINKLFGRAKNEEEILKLNAPEETKLLEGPETSKVLEKTDDC